MKEVAALKIVLNRTSPEIYRKVIVPLTVTFFDLHLIIQISMGWKNAHLYEFLIGDYKMGYTGNDEEFEDIADAGEVQLELLLKTGDTFQYLYDFGDHWRHTITVDSVFEAQKNMKYPVCVDGKETCPPEDSGGVLGFYEALDILKDTNHPDYSTVKKWLGKTYNHGVSLEKINMQLQKFKSYMRDWD